MIIKNIMYVITICLLLLNPMYKKKQEILNKYVTLCDSSTLSSCKTKINNSINELFKNYKYKILYNLFVILFFDMLIHIFSLNNYVQYCIYIIIFYLMLNISFEVINYNTDKEFDTDKYTIICADNIKCKLKIKTNKYIKDKNGYIILINSNKTKNNFNKDIEQKFKNLNISNRMYKLSVILIYYFLRYGILV